MAILGVLFIISAIFGGITEKQYGIMAFGIVLGTFLIWYSPKHKEKALVRKEERHRKRMIKAMSDYYSTEEGKKALEEEINQIDKELEKD